MCNPEGHVVFNHFVKMFAVLIGGNNIIIINNNKNNNNHNNVWLLTFTLI